MIWPLINSSLPIGHAVDKVVQPSPIHLPGFESPAIFLLKHLWIARENGIDVELAP